MRAALTLLAGVFGGACRRRRSRRRAAASARALRREQSHRDERPPGAVASLAATVGRVRIESEVVAPGGYSLEDHWTDGTAKTALDSGRFDVVVFQQGPSSLASSRVNLVEWLGRWAAEARVHGARPALLTVWPERVRFSVFPAVIANHRAAASVFERCLVPRRRRVAGSASPATAAPRPHGPDGFHPSRLGTHPTAVVVYAGLTGTLPRPLPRDVAGLQLDVRTARLVRAAAARAYPPR